MVDSVAVVIPNWNGATELPACLASLSAQSHALHLIVVDNGSTDNSLEVIADHYPAAEIFRHKKNHGYAGGVNPGFVIAIERGFKYVATFNNDAVADSKWLEKLVAHMQAHPKVGISAAKILTYEASHLDSTGEGYTIWGLPYPRGRGDKDDELHDFEGEILGASGGASLYRVSMLEEIGLFDEDFFAYYEDVDLSLRAQLAGWKINYVAQAIVYHQTSTTGKKIKGLFTVQTIKNYILIIIKDVPLPLLWKVAPRFTLAQTLFIARAVLRGHAWWALKALIISFLLIPKKLSERYKIQSKRKVSVDYILSIMTHDLPPNAHNLRRLRQYWWRLQGRVS